MPGAVVVSPEAALPDTLVDHDSSLDFIAPDAVLERPLSVDKAEVDPEEQQVFMTDAMLELQPQQQPVMQDAQMLPCVQWQVGRCDEKQHRLWQWAATDF